MRIKTIIYEDDGETVIFESEPLPEDVAEYVLDIEGKEVIIKNEIHGIRL